MNVKIYVSPEVKDTLWSQLAMRAASAEITRKRYTPEIIEADSIFSVPLDALYEPDEKRLLIYIGTSLSSMPETLSYLAKYGVHAICLNYESSSNTGKYSKILLNYRDGMHKIVNYLTAAGRDGIALYGINPNSATDLIKDGFFTEYLQARGGNASRDIYYNYASLGGCFARFYENRANYNAVICANDIAALALINRLKEQGLRVPEDFYVVSFGSTVLASMATPSVTTVTVDHEELGRQAVLAYSYLYKNPGEISLTVKVDASLVIRASTADTPDTGEDFLGANTPPVPNVDFYDDPTAQSIFSAEKLLVSCDDLDQGILDGIMSGETYPSIAERLYTSENVISYRIKRMCKVTGCTRKSDLVALLTPYIK